MYTGVNILRKKLLAVKLRVRIYLFSRVVA